MNRFFLAFIVIFGFTIGASAYFFHSVLWPTPTHETRVLIRTGQTTHQIVNVLHEKGITPYPKILEAFLRISKVDRHLHAGRFTLDTPSSFFDIAKTLSKPVGPESLVRFTVPEGYSALEIDQKLAKEVLIEPGEFQRYIDKVAKKKLSEKYPFLADIPIESVEGYLFPDTYYFVEGTTVDVLADMMIKNFQDKIWVTWAASPHQWMTFHQMLTLSSIVEKEALMGFEMPKIAGVFRNRLAKNMYLESCPTVTFAMGNPSKRFLLYKDLDFVSPYNTYRNAGLPPGPIGNPGLAAFQAALIPQTSPYLFFVADGAGTHLFSRTYQEHANKQMGLLGRGINKAPDATIEVKRPLKKP